MGINNDSDANKTSTNEGVVLIIRDMKEGTMHKESVKKIFLSL